jgi:hypothetical protein
MLVHNNAGTMLFRNQSGIVPSLCLELNISHRVAEMCVRSAVSDSKKTTETYRNRAAEIRAVLEWVRRPEYRTELLSLVKKYERLAEQAERNGESSQPSAEESPPEAGNTGRAGRLLDP